MLMLQIARDAKRYVYKFIIHLIFSDVYHYRKSLTTKRIAEKMERLYINQDIE